MRTIDLSALPLSQGFAGAPKDLRTEFQATCGAPLPGDRRCQTRLGKRRCGDVFDRRCRHHQPPADGDHAATVERWN